MKEYIDTTTVAPRFVGCAAEADQLWDQVELRAAELSEVRVAGRGTSWERDTLFAPMCNNAMNP